MPELRGSLVRVTASPSTAVGVLVRAPEVRAGAGGVVLTEETQVPVDRGEFTVTLEPGAAVMTVQHAGYPGEVIPLLVVEGQSTIMAAMQAASIADGAEKSEIERLLAAVTEQAHAVAADAGKAAGAVQAVQSAKSKAEAAQHAAEAAKAAAQASGKPSGGWLKSDFEQSVQDTLTDVTDAVSASSSSSRGKIARYNQYRAAIYVTEPKNSTETANKRYVDGEVQGLAAQLNAAKDELSAGIAAASFITGIFYMQNYGGEVAKKALGSAVECVKETNSGYLVRKEVDALVLTLTETSKVVRFNRVSEYETVSASPGAIAIYFIIGQPQD